MRSDAGGPFEVRVAASEPAAADIVRLVVEVPEPALQRTIPGQFADFLVPDDPGWHILRRPLSVAGIHPAEHQATFYFRLAGAGTRRLASAAVGSTLNMLLPLGRGYTPPSPGEKIWLVGGGTGAASILSLPSFYDADFTLFLGFRSPQHAFGLPVSGSAAYVTYDSRGELVTDLLLEKLREGERPDRIAACGPVPMYRALRRVAAEIPTEVSLEERMGCGTGGCQACVAGVGGRLVRTCTEGPVFPLEEVNDLAD